MLELHRAAAEDQLEVAKRSDTRLSAFLFGFTVFVWR